MTGTALLYNTLCDSLPYLPSIHTLPLFHPIRLPLEVRLSPFQGSMSMCPALAALRTVITKTSQCEVCIIPHDTGQALQNATFPAR